ncbi:IPT/TIG domain-containing protein [Alistipes sp. ZOR0009]|uniref:IPT/TIG domain-containing protein n=1 Tax=Alistipes sp. ZOR0009 TaxID=1339253 RepID=UPI00397774BE
MKSGNTVRLATSGYPALNYVLTPVEESETRLRFSTAGISKPASFDLYVKSNGKEEKYTAKVKLTLKPAVIASVSPLKVKAGETITITGENFNKETLSMVLIDNGAHAITYVDDKHVTIKASTDLKPGKYLLEIKIGATAPSGGPTFKVIYSTQVEIIA